MCTEPTCAGTDESPAARSLIGRRGVLGLAAGLLAAGATAGAASAVGQRPHKVLVFTRTNGYRHASIPAAISTIADLGAAHGIGVVATEDPSVFTPATLQGFTAIVFANTVGNVLTDPGRAAIQQFVTSGGGWMGVHAAADTEYDWPFYTDLLSGGRFLCHPLINQPATVVRESVGHLATSHLPARWSIKTPEEYYSFTANVRGTAEVLLSVDEKTYLQDPNTSLLPSPTPPYKLSKWVSGKMGDHPICWQRPIGAGFSWYTALGHEKKLYSDALYRQHLLGGLLTVSRHGREHLAG